MNKVLILSPHTDDAELGSGASIARLIEEKKEVYVAVFSTVEDSVPPDHPKNMLELEFNDSMDILGIKPDNRFIFHYPVRRLSYYRQEVLDDMIRIRAHIKPDTVFIPSKHDLHQDHGVVHIEALRAFKDLSLLCYELPWNQIAFQENFFVTISQKHLDLKWLALKAYKSQFLLQRPYFSYEFMKGLAMVRGVQIKEEYAEAFEVIRLKYEK